MDLPHGDRGTDRSASRDAGRWTMQTQLREIAERGEQPAIQWLYGDAVASLSGADLADRSNRLAANLVDRGLASEELVILLAPNGPEWVIARFAIAAAGAVAVALDDLAKEHDIATALADTACRWALASPRHASVLRRLAGQRINIVVIDGETGRAREGDSAAPAQALPAIAATAPAMLVYTSGTTGAPKSFLLSYDHLWANVRALADERLVGRDDRVLVPLPLHHVYPFVVGILTSLESGAVVALSDAAGRSEILQALRVMRPTVIVGVPRLYAALVAGFQARVAKAGFIAAAAFKAMLRLMIWVRRRLAFNPGRRLFRRLRARIGSDIRLLVSGGARLEPEVLWPLVGLGFDVRSGYGLAETASIFTGNLPRRERLGSEGQPFQGGELRIADANEEGIGEIQLRGPNVFTGYRGDPRANREAFTADGWFRSGDLGRLDADGYLYVTGRTKEMLVLGGGKKVHPEELEKVYGDTPYIREIAVIEHAGALAALVAPDLKAIRDSGEQRVEDLLRVTLAEKSQKLPRYQRLSGYVLVSEPLPRTRLGKYRRFLLPDIYDRARRGIVRPPEREPTGEDRELLARAPVRQVWQLLQERYPPAAVTLGANLQLDLGIDSLEWIGLLLSIEQRAGIHLAEQDVAGLATVRDLLSLADTAAATPIAPKPVGADLRWIQPTGPMLGSLAVALYWLNRLLMRALFRVTASGLENLPAQGPYVLVSNHASDLDPLLIGAVLSLPRMRQTYWGGTVTRLFTRSWIAPLWQALHVMPVDERLPTSSLALPSAVLARGDCLVWFPEAWRSPDGSVQHFMPGIGKLIADSGAPAVPVFVAGSYEALPRDRRVPRLCPVRIHFGHPLSPPALSETGEGSTPYERIANSLRREVLRLAAAIKG